MHTYHYITLHYIPYHTIPYHTYIHTYTHIHIYIHIYIYTHIYICVYGNQRAWPFLVGFSWPFKYDPVTTLNQAVFSNLWTPLGQDFSRKNQKAKSYGAYNVGKTIINHQFGDCWNPTYLWWWLGDGLWHCVTHMKMFFFDGDITGI